MTVGLNSPFSEKLASDGLLLTLPPGGYPCVSSLFTGRIFQSFHLYIIEMNDSFLIFDRPSIRLTFQKIQFNFDFPQNERLVHPDFPICMPKLSRGLSCGQGTSNHPNDVPLRLLML